MSDRQVASVRNEVGLVPHVESAGPGDAGKRARFGGRLIPLVEPSGDIGVQLDVQRAEVGPPSRSVGRGPATGRRLGLTDGLSVVLTRRGFIADHDRGQVWVDVATTLATGVGAIAWIGAGCAVGVVRPSDAVAPYGGDHGGGGGRFFRCAPDGWWLVATGAGMYHALHLAPGRFTRWCSAKMEVLRRPPAKDVRARSVGVGGLRVSVPYTFRRHADLATVCRVPDPGESLVLGAVHALRIDLEKDGNAGG